MRQSYEVLSKLSINVLWVRLGMVNIVQGNLQSAEIGMHEMKGSRDIVYVIATALRVT